MCQLLKEGLIDALVTYTPVLDNMRVLYSPIVEKEYSIIKVALLKRKNEDIDVALWTK